MSSDKSTASAIHYFSEQFVSTCEYCRVEYKTGNGAISQKLYETLTGIQTARLEDGGWTGIQTARLEDKKGWTLEVNWASSLTSE